MKVQIIIAALFISCVAAKDLASLKAGSSFACFENCIAFAEQLKGKSIADPVKEAKNFCATVDAGCEGISGFAKFIDVFVRIGIPTHKICLSKQICPKRVEVRGQVGCTVCKTIVNTIQISLKAFNQTEKEIINAVAELCKVLSPLKVQSQVCKDVLQFVDAIIQDLLRGLSPGDICIKLKICNSEKQSTKVISKIAAFMPFIARKLGEAKQDLPYIMNRYKKWESKQTAVGEETSCAICKTVTTIVTSALQFTNATTEAVEETIKAFCDTRPEAEKEKCLVYVSKMKQLVAYIEQRLSPGQVCEKLGYCSKSAGSALMEPALVLRKHFGKKGDETACEICKTVTQIISYSITFTNETMGAVEKTVETFCNMEPEGRREKCLVYVSKMKQLVAYIEQRLSPGQACEKLGYCSKSAGSALVEPALVLRKHFGKKGDETACEICKTVTQIISYSITFTNETMGAVEKTVETFCNMEPEGRREKCLVYVSKMKQLVAYIEQRLSPGQACEKLGYCSKSAGSALVEPALVLRKHFGKKGDKTACEICKTVAQIISYSITFTNETMSSVEKTVELFCNMEPEGKREKCLFYVERMDQIAKYIEQKLSPGGACVKLGYCASSGGRGRKIKGPSRRHEKKMKSVCQLCSTYERIVEKKNEIYQANSKKMRDYVEVFCRNTADGEVAEKCLTVAPVLIATDGMANRVLDKSLCKKAVCSKTFVMATSLLKGRSSEPCSTCKYSIDLFKRKFDSINTMIQNYLKETRKICKKSDFKDLSRQCSLFVSRTEELFDDISDEIESKKACQMLRLCRSKPRFSFQTFMKAFSDENPACGICKTAVEASQHETSEQGVKDVMESACNGMKKFTGMSSCDQIIGYADVIASKAGEKKSPEDVCKGLNLCGEKFHFGKLIGGFMKGFQNMFG